MRRFFQAGSIVLAVVAMTAAILRSDEKKAAQPAELSPEAQQKAFEAFIKPGREHEQLARLVGKWNAVVSSYFENPEQPSKSEGKATFRLLMGGRYLQQDFSTSFGGEAFTGMGVTGFDNAKRKYVSTWIDTMGTGIMVSEGTYDRETNSLVEIGESSSPTGPMKLKSVSRYLDDDKFIFTMYLVTPGGDQKMMEITYTRAKVSE